MAKMIGRKCPTGPGGRDCACCGDAPGKRKQPRRTMKRRERQAWKREAGNWWEADSQDWFSIRDCGE